MKKLINENTGFYVENIITKVFRFKTLKGNILFFVTVAITLALIIEAVAGVFLSALLFKKGGWKNFTEYSYGEEIKVNKKDNEWFSELSEKTEIKNSDGKTLTGLKITNENVSHSYIVICHQYGGSATTMTEYVKHFYSLGFNIVLPELRGHGESSYKSISMGWKDSGDLKVWIDDIISQDKEAKIVLFGVSMGANAVALAASEELPANVRFAIADSCYTSVHDLVKEYIGNETHLPSFPVLSFTSVFSKGKIGENFRNADTVEKIQNIEIPIMFINGENDTVVPPLVSKKLYENCNSEGVEEVIIPGGTHGRNKDADEASYWAYVDLFVLNNLGI